MYKKILFTSLLLMAISLVTATAQKKYPLIQSGGGVFDIPEAVPIADPKMMYKVVVELAKPSDKPDSVNASLDKLARLVNAHIAVGIPKKNLDIVAVAHFQGTHVILSDEAYQKYYGVPNPNTKLINELAKNGVRFYVCGQSIRVRKFTNDKRNENVSVTESALITLTTLQLKGYAVITP